MTRPVVIGLTGSIGMGKSTVARMFARAGVPVFDADAAVHALQAPGGRALPPIEAAFPGTVVGGTLDRAKLRAAVFGDPAALRRLEAIVHPLVAAAQARFRRRHRARRAVVLDVPLLFERGGWRACDLTVVVSAPYRVQRARVLARANATPMNFENILAAQMPDRAKRARADVVIETGRGLRHTRAAVRHLLRGLRTGAISRVCARSSSIPRPPASIPRTVIASSRSAASRSTSGCPRGRSSTAT